MKYVIIDRNRHDYYCSDDDIYQGFLLDRLLDFYHRYELPYKLHFYNNGNVIVIR